jgi:hypothetical protein
VGHQPNRDALVRELAEARKPLDNWRRQHGAPNPIPAAVWEKAVELASRHGVGVVAAGLRLDYAKLKRKLAESEKTVALVAPVRPTRSVKPSFVELFGPSSLPVETPAQLGPCVVRIRSARGIQVRLDLDGSDTSGLAKLLKELL